MCLGWPHTPLRRCLRSLKTPLKTNGDSAQLTRMRQPWHPRRPFRRVRLVPAPGCTCQHGGRGLRAALPAATNPGPPAMALVPRLCVTACSYFSNLKRKKKKQHPKPSLKREGGEGLASASVAFLKQHLDYTLG